MITTIVFCEKNIRNFQDESMKTPSAKQGPPASELISARINELGDWRGETLARMRKLIRAADPEVVEEWKWMGTPVWSHNGIICTGETYKSVVKLTFARGASLKDPARLFNSSLDGNTRRAIDIREGETVDAKAFKALVREAVALNTAGKPKAPVAAKAKAPDAEKASAVADKGRRSEEGKTKKPASAAKPVLLAGGNPQIAKGEGDAAVQAWLAAVPGWKTDIARRIDELIEGLVPGVRKAVKWNSPMYGIAGQGWFAGLHVFTKAVKVTFFRAMPLQPVPPGGGGKDARWIDVHEHDFDEAQMASWIRQAAALPGWMTADIAR
jgi:hypothetical protein